MTGWVDDSDGTGAADPDGDGDGYGAADPDGDGDGYIVDAAAKDTGGRDGNTRGMGDTTGSSMYFGGSQRGGV